MIAETLTIPVDREHVGIRWGILTVFLVVGLVTFSIVNQLIPSAGLNIIAGIIGFAVAALAGRLVEPILKQRWPSGRLVHMDAQGARITKQGRPQVQIQGDQAASILRWCFKIPKRGRMPKGWYVVACALEQDDSYLAVYTFASPEQFGQLNQLVKFAELSNDKKSDTARNDSLRLAGEQRRLRLAEEHRWHDGAEMLVTDFEQFITKLNGQFPLWAE